MKRGGKKKGRGDNKLRPSCIPAQTNDDVKSFCVGEGVTIVWVRGRCCVGLIVAANRLG